jgi:hypothetical protein
MGQIPREKNGVRTMTFTEGREPSGLAVVSLSRVIGDVCRYAFGGVLIDKVIAANQLALARAHIVFPRVLELEQCVPKWLLHLATEAGVTDFQDKHGLQLPTEVKQYYKSTRLICFLQEAWGVDVFLQDMRNKDDLPEIRNWCGMPHVVIGYFAHSDTECGAQLTGDRCCMYWEGVIDGHPQPSVTLAEWVHGAAVLALTTKE